MARYVNDSSIVSKSLGVKMPLRALVKFGHTYELTVTFPRKFHSFRNNDMANACTPRREKCKKQKKKFSMEEWNDWNADDALYAPEVEEVSTAIREQRGFF